ncbi:DUF2723 domain-containing protein [Taibaiella sp. KBW10]|uniref:DUF2723 domain-containing protein n=1 Tax=Taibaiella sp. KBW10 TaxID=2153357 RepID=UPI000F595E20|nr:DUF2723 domain-containing protein [Taibaiella sp. KBW10]RQO29789.1 DUF2723 domain-containing protein [Taibaiella sp. KBW10]
MSFKKINNITGWAVFAIALIVYLMTMEPTVSFWDCGEFISCAYKLQVGHSPGAPLFMLLGRIFAIFAPAPQQVAMFVNALSAFASAFTILFLFWSITHFAKRIFYKNDETLAQGNILAIIGAGVVGALAYTFSDTFWFSAVEGEVYATSSFFTAVVFWAILKWEESSDIYADRWLILIAYLIGLSIGVHLLSLLAIPTIALIYYFKRYKPTLTGGLLAYFIGGVVLLVVQYGVIQYIPIFASKFELLFVNSFNMPFNSGAIFFLILFAAILAGVLLYAKKSNRYLLHLSTLSMVFMTIGYTCYVPTIIRAKAGVSINMTNPDNVMSLIPYLQRTQYGTQPFLTGQYFDTKPIDYKMTSENYLPVKVDGKDHYNVVGENIDYVYEERHLFPRIWSPQPNHVSYYRSNLGLADGEPPTARDNFSFFLDYQINHMFWRYFMWNYAGRQNDYQGNGGEPQNGNWISGINGLDKAMGRGDFNKMPDSYKNNKAHNKLYLIPFIVGLIGLIYQFKKNKLDAYVVLSLFFFTGIAVQLYINNTPYQPRERDYQYIAAYAFAIWIGFGVLMIREWLSKLVKNESSNAILATVIGLIAVPMLMASQEWDDHDRSNKTLALDHARNMLANCDKDAILITNGDNETYPLWYIQEVEGYRTDVRIFNYNLLGTDWQNLQMFNRVNDGAAVPMIWTKEYVGGFGNDNSYSVQEDPRVASKAINFNEVMQFMMDPNHSVASMLPTERKSSFVPARNMYIAVDKQAVLASGLIAANDTNVSIPDSILMTVKGNNLIRSDLSMMNIIAGIAREGWKRPLYVCNGVLGDGSVAGLENYLRKEGTLLKFVPNNIRPAVGGFTPVDNLDKSFNFFNKVYTFGKANTDKVYYDESNKRTFYGYRNDAAGLAIQLALAGRSDDAVKILDRSLAQISESSFPTEITFYEQTGMLFVQAYMTAGNPKKAEIVANKLIKYAADFTNYYVDLSERKQEGTVQLAFRNLEVMRNLTGIAQQAKQEDLVKKWTDAMMAMNQKLEAKSEPFKQYMQQYMQQMQQRQQ